MTTDKKSKLLAKKAQIEAQLKAMQAKQSEAERKKDTRRKVIAGALALEHAEIDKDFHRTLFKLLNRYIERDQDRELFGLEAKERSAANEESKPASSEPSVKRSFESA